MSQPSDPPSRIRVRSGVEEPVGAAFRRHGDDRVHYHPERDDPSEDRREPPPRTDRRDEDDDDHRVEDPAPVPREVADRRLRPQALEHEDGDDERAEDGAGKAPCAAEDHHRVDDDQDLRVVVVGERALQQRGVDRSRRAPRRPRRRPTARSLSQFTGMLIACAASVSSLSARHARPVREWFASVSAAKTTTTAARVM